MPRRIESPSSLLTHKQCPRKYFYQYIEKRRTKPTIHTVRGNLVHEALDAFFATPPQLDQATYPEQCINHLRMLYDALWEKHASEFLALSLPPATLRLYYTETLAMLSLWLEKFLVKLGTLQCPAKEGFLFLTPLCEQEVFSQRYQVKGYIDVLEKIGDDVRLMDYKTGSKAEISEEYKLQLALYALLYREKSGKAPKEVGIYFLKHPGQFEQTMPVTEELMKEAVFAIETHHLATESSSINDYPQKPGPLCKWRTGQCDFCELCFAPKSI